MSIRKYKDSDYDLVASWYEARGKQPPDPRRLSTTGFIADERVAGWLYVTDSSMSFIDCVIADPLTVPSLRRASLLKLCQVLVETSFMVGCTDIMGITAHPSIEKICDLLGFKQGPSTLGIWVLSEKD